MQSPSNLFDLSPYDGNRPLTAPRNRRRPLAISPNVWLALVSLKATLDSVPEAELESRAQVYRDKFDRDKSESKPVRTESG